MAMSISTAAQYEEALREIEALMNAFSDGENTVNDSKIADLAKKIEEYEDRNIVMPMPLVIKKPETLPDVIELKMFEKKMKHKDMAKTAGNHRYTLFGGHAWQAQDQYGTGKAAL